MILVSKIKKKHPYPPSPKMLVGTNICKDLMSELLCLRVNLTKLHLKCQSLDQFCTKRSEFTANQPYYILIRSRDTNSIWGSNV